MTTTEPRFQPLNTDTFDDDQKALFAILNRFVGEPLGGVAGMWLRNPGTGMKLARLTGHFATHPTLPDALRELAIVVTAHHWKAQLSWDHHGKLAQAAGVPSETIAAVAEGRDLSEADGEFAAVADFCRELLTDRFVRASTFAKVRRIFDDRQMVDLVSTIGLASLSCMCQVVQYETPNSIATNVD